MASLTTNIEGSFTLFPNLSPELRDMIWKAALPGPRIVPLCVRSAINSDMNELSKRCCALNSQFENMMLACHESSTVITKSYDKLIAQIQPKASSSTPSESNLKTDAQDSPPLFLYVDYNIDTVYMDTEVLEVKGAFEIKQIYPNLNRVQHLALGVDEALTHTGLDWQGLKPACAALNSLTIVEIRDLYQHPYGEEWRLIKLGSDLDGPIKGEEEIGSRPGPGGYWNIRDKALDKHGKLAVSCLDANYSEKLFAEEVKKRSDWKDVKLSCAILATREIGSPLWKLGYYVTVLRRNGTINSAKSHWHEETFVQTGDDSLSSCSPPGIIPGNLCCYHCKQQRWQGTSDAFWLAGNESNPRHITEN